MKSAPGGNTILFSPSDARRLRDEAARRRPSRKAFPPVRGSPIAGNAVHTEVRMRILGKIFIPIAREYAWLCIRYKIFIRRAVSDIYRSRKTRNRPCNFETPAGS